jgi:hypothetical protein
MLPDRGPVRARLVIAIAAATAAGATGCHPRQAAPAGARAVDAAQPADMIRPVYALTDGPIDPLAEKLCAALHATRARRHRECCAAQDGGAAATPAAAIPDRAGECARVLGAAVRGEAIRLDAGEVDRCASAVAAAYQGCDWLGFDPLPAPAECRGVVHGTLGAASGCRSSLECQGLLHCENLDAGTPGVCRAPKGHFARCAGPPPPDDPLAVLLLDDRLDETHPECAGHCERGRCATPITAKGPCEDSRQCAPGFHCAKQRCVPGRLSRAGEPCKDACERPSRCVRGACRVADKEGVPCAVDDECLGRCVHEGEKGRCGPACGRD